MSNQPTDDHEHKETACMCMQNGAAAQRKEAEGCCGGGCCGASEAAMLEDTEEAVRV